MGGMPDLLAKNGTMVEHSHKVSPIEMDNSDSLSGHRVVGEAQQDKRTHNFSENKGEAKFPECASQNKTVTYLAAASKSEISEATTGRERIKIILKRKSPGGRHSVNVIVGAPSEEQSVNGSGKSVSCLTPKNSGQPTNEADACQISGASGGSGQKNKHVTLSSIQQSGGSVSGVSSQVLKKPKLESECRLFGVGLTINARVENPPDTTVSLQTESPSAYPLTSELTEEILTSAHVQRNPDSDGFLETGFYATSTNKLKSVVSSFDNQFIASAMDPSFLPQKECFADEHRTTSEEEVGTKPSSVIVDSSNADRIDLRPKARRTPLAFPAAATSVVDGATQAALGSSVTESPKGNPALLPAKRSPLPLPVARRGLSFSGQVSAAESSVEIDGLPPNILDQDPATQRSSLVQRRLESLSSCQATSTSLELVSTVNEAQKVENEADVQTITRNSDTWISLRCTEAVKQERELSHSEQNAEIDEFVNKCHEREMNQYHGQNGLIKVDQEAVPPSGQPEHVAQWLPAEDHMALQSSDLQSLSGEGAELPPFSFQRLINGDMSDLGENDDDGEDDDELGGGEEEERIAFSADWNMSERHPEQIHEPDIDMSERSESQESDDIYYGQDRFSSQRIQDQKGRSQPCSECKSLKIVHKCNHEIETDVQIGSSTDNILVSEAGASPSQPGASCKSPHTPLAIDEGQRTASEMSDDLCLLPGRSVSSPTGIKLKIKMPKDVTLKEVPGTAKTLLATGLLEGHRVRYLYRGGEINLTGVVQNGGILCDCKMCKGENIVNVSGFEKHAGSNARHPSDFVFLQNGKSLHDILEAGWQAAEGKALEALREAINGRGDVIENGKCRRCGYGGGFSECKNENCSSPSHPDCAGANQSSTGWLCSRCAGGNYQRQRSEPNSAKKGRNPQLNQTRDMSLHKLVFLPGGLPDGTELAYYIKGQRILGGVKKSPGICCGCCNQVVSCSQFEAHAGWGSRRNPYNSIYLCDGQSLHDVALALASQKTSKVSSSTYTIQKSGDNEDFCAECGDGGDLVLCDGCPGAYHAECVGVAGIPDGDWFCPLCQDQVETEKKSSGKKSVKGSGKFSAAWAKEKLFGRCQLVVKASENTVGGCVLCRNGDFLKSGFGAKTIMLCDQCEREYHVGCLKERGLADLKELPAGEWFCGADCKRIHKILQVLVSNGPEPVHSTILSKVLAKQQENNFLERVQENALKITWQLLHGRRGNPENGRVLSEAAGIFAESFDPIVDSTSGRDLIPLMVYSRSIRDQDFRGMYCAVLKCNEAVVSAAIIRVFGRQFAEMPLVATNFANRGQGYYQILHLCIERLLGVLQIEHLILPAAEGAEGIWTKKFGFSKLQDEQLRWFRSEVQMMIFQGSSMLLKVISSRPGGTGLSRKREIRS